MDGHNPSLTTSSFQIVQHFFQFQIYIVVRLKLSFMKWVGMNFEANGL